MNQKTFLISGMVFVLFFLTCGPKIMIPPNVDLRKYQNVGFIDFVCDNEGNLDDCVSERFLETLRSYQKDAHIIRLGSQEEVLKSVAAGQMDEKTIQSIGQKYDVTAIITGTVHVSDVKAIVDLNPDIKMEGGGIQPEGRRLEAVASITISASVWETEQGTKLWTGSKSGQEKVEEVFISPDSKVLFDAKEYRSAYRDLVKPLIKSISTDFKIRKKRI